MVGQKCFKVIGITLFLLSSLRFARNETINGQSLGASLTWRSKAKEAVNGISRQLEKNLILVLTELGKDSLKAGRTVKHGLNTLVNAILKGVFGITGLIASTPKLLGERLPVQLIGILKEMQKDKKVSSDLNATISTIIHFIEKAEASGVSQKLFKPATAVVPNLLYGVNRFLISILNGVFFLIGARDPNIYYTTTTSTENPDGRRNITKESAST